MSVEIMKTSLPGVVLINRRAFEDSRGFFLEIYRRDKFKKSGLDISFIQDNHSSSHKGVLRGLHYQLKYPQGKLISTLCGEIFDVAVDVRRGSPTFGKCEAFQLSAKNRRQLFIPAGFAHGFYVCSERADVMYKCTNFYHARDDHGILWSDPDLGIEWPFARQGSPVLSDKDQSYSRLNEIPDTDLPAYSPEP